MALLWTETHQKDTNDEDDQKMLFVTLPFALHWIGLVRKRAGANLPRGFHPIRYVAPLYLRRHLADDAQRRHSPGGVYL